MACRRKAELNEYSFVGLVEVECYHVTCSAYKVRSGAKQVNSLFIFILMTGYEIIDYVFLCCVANFELQYK